MLRYKIDNLKKRNKFLIVSALFIALLFVSVGYASYTTRFTLEEMQAIILREEKIFISGVSANSRQIAQAYLILILMMKRYIQL